MQRLKVTWVHFGSLDLMKHRVAYLLRDSKLLVTVRLLFALWNWFKLVYRAVWAEKHAPYT